jgi:hypothetical protein
MPLEKNLWKNNQATCLFSHSLKIGKKLEKRKEGKAVFLGVPGVPII